MIEHYIGIVILLALMLLITIRLILAKNISNRILALNVFGTLTVLLILVYSAVIKDFMYLDVAAVYVLINFITTVGLLRYYKSGQL